MLDGLVSSHPCHQRAISPNSTNLWIREVVDEPVGEQRRVTLQQSLEVLLVPFDIRVRSLEVISEKNDNKQCR
jgi:hypothetical protein